MTFKKKLTDEQLRAFLVDHEDGWKIKELSVIYKISVRTVYRLLAEYDRPPSNKKKPRKKVPKRPLVERELKPCGTNAAYQRHRKNGEYPYTPCLAAHAENVKLYSYKRKR